MSPSLALGVGEGCGAIGFVCTFLGDCCWEVQMPKKEGGLKKKKFFINNSVEALIPINQENRGLLKLHVPLGWDYVVGGRGGGRKGKGGGFSEYIEIFFIF